MSHIFRITFSSAVAWLLAPAAIAAQTVTTRVDSVRHEVVITASSFDVPATMKMSDMDGAMEMDDGPLKLFRFDWPVDGYAKGFHVEVVDSRGAVMPRSLLHHLIGINLDRRQFIYPATERLFAMGKETEAVSLPGKLAIPLDAGQRLGFYVAWHNETGRDFKNLSVRVIMNWVPASVTKDLIAVLPVYLDVNNDVGGDDTFDITPGKSSKAFEFVSPVSGKLLAVGGHLHDYGAAVRLEDAATGATLVRLPAERERDGRIRSMPRKFFAFNPIKLEAGHRYRVVAEYDSPLDKTIRNGGMANLVAAIAPEDPRRWPAIDPSDPVFKKDVQSLGVSDLDFGQRRPLPSGDGNNK
jgi:hypothetical protein